MRAIVVREFGEPEVMRVEDVPDPVPGSGEILVRTRAIGVNPVETYIRTGTHAIKPTLPYTPGTDAAGEVLAVGEGVAGLAVGDRVYVAKARPGAYAELLAAPASGTWPLDQGLSFEQGAAIGVPYGTAYRALHDRGGVRAHEWVFVHGASGAVGTAVVQLAVAHGARVIGTAGTPAGRQLVRDLGAGHALDHRDPGHFEQARAATGGRGVDLIVEMLANANLGRDLGILAMRGRVIVVGSRGSIEITPRDLMSREARVEGMMLGNASPEDVERIHAGLRAGFAAGVLRPIVGATFRLADAPRAHRQVMGSNALGKVLLVP